MHKQAFFGFEYGLEQKMMNSGKSLWDGWLLRGLADIREGRQGNMDV